MGLAFVTSLIVGAVWWPITHDLLVVSTSVALGTYFGASVTSGKGSIPVRIFYPVATGAAMAVIESIRH
jgi:hypothetical protein